MKTPSFASDANMRANVQAAIVLPIPGGPFIQKKNKNKNKHSRVICCTNIPSLFYLIKTSIIIKEKKHSF
jgi:hypothetical protein